MLLRHTGRVQPSFLREVPASRLLLVPSRGGVPTGLPTGRDRGEEAHAEGRNDKAQGGECQDREATRGLHHRHQRAESRVG